MGPFGLVSGPNCFAFPHDVSSKVGGYGGGAIVLQQR